MLVNLKEILADARKNHYAVGAFNGIDTTTVRAVIGAAEEANMPVILMFAEVHQDIIALDMIGEVMLSAAKKAKVPVCVHLDHGTDFDYLKQAINMGFTSVMYDGSALPYEENLKNTKLMVEYAHARGASVEAELGQLPNREGGGDSAQNPDALYTNPAQAKDFIERTGADALAIAFGTAHGVYAKAPVLNFDIISKVRDEVGVPLVMHGGSGVSPEGFETAIQNGITKINYFTYMSVAGAVGVADYLKGTEQPYYHDITLAALDAMKNDVLKAMRVFAAGTNPLA